MSDLVGELVAEYYETARECDASYVCVDTANGYEFGENIPRGLAVLGLVGGIINPVILDIGAGDGTFLAEAKEKDSESRCIGFAVQEKDSHTPNLGIEWVYGDFIRPETWRPDDTLRQGLVDIAVGSWSFQHFADPLKAIEIAHGLLKDQGHLIVDGFVLYLDPAQASEAAQAVLQVLDDHSGSGGVRIEQTSEWLSVEDLHIQKRPDSTLEFDKVVLKINPEDYGLVYAPA